MAAPNVDLQNALRNLSAAQKSYFVNTRLTDQQAISVFKKRGLFIAAPFVVFFVSLFMANAFRQLQIGWVLTLMVIACGAGCFWYLSRAINKKDVILRFAEDEIWVVKDKAIVKKYIVKELGSFSIHLEEPEAVQTRSSYQFIYLALYRHSSGRETYVPGVGKLNIENETFYFWIDYDKQFNDMQHLLRRWEQSGVLFSEYLKFVSKGFMGNFRFMGDLFWNE